MLTLEFMTYASLAFDQMIVQDNKLWNVVEYINIKGRTTE